jgi:hypothetical protein
MGEGVFWGSAAVQPPADHRRFNRAAGFVIAPFAIDVAAGERQLIRAAVVFAKHLDRLIRRRFAVAIKLSQTSFARCHFLVPRCRLIAPAPVPRFLTGVSTANLTARMRFPYDILDQARNKLTGMGRHWHEDFDARPDRARDTIGAGAVRDDIR